MKHREDLSDRLLTRAEVAEIFQVSPSTITRWAEAGKLPAVKTLGGHRRYEANAVMKLAQCLTPELPHQSNPNIVEESSMEKAIINAPAMYGDHHVVEVRRILFELSGVEDVNASSCFQAVEVIFDPTKLSTEEITDSLAEAGYLEPLTVPAETGIAVTQRPDQDEKIFFRHTTAFEQAKDVVSFAQDVHYAGRPLWPCPGLGVIEAEENEKEKING
jgi:excisionase family DNA binding protein